MKSLNWLGWFAVCGIAFCLFFQLCARPIIDKAHAGYSAQDRESFCVLREQSAQERTVGE